MSGYSKKQVIKSAIPPESQHKLKIKKIKKTVFKNEKKIISNYFYYPVLAANAR